MVYQGGGVYTQVSLSDDDVESANTPINRHLNRTHLNGFLHEERLVNAYWRALVVLFVALLVVGAIQFIFQVYMNGSKQHSSFPLMLSEQ
mmetsp:Transcript_28668/g.42456  ORF Transcript_28668/g.42456 Transcript_28668/m.42456 type:complete len:90 (-) Transcript_28668:412-681(-)